MRWTRYAFNNALILQYEILWHGCMHSSGVCGRVNNTEVVLSRRTVNMGILAECKGIYLGRTGPTAPEHDTVRVNTIHV